MRDFECLMIERYWQGQWSTFGFADGWLTPGSYHHATILYQRRYHKIKRLRKNQRKWLERLASQGWTAHRRNLEARWQLSLPVSHHELLELSRGALGQTLSPEQLQAIIRV
jgi:hypothetical protein